MILFALAVCWILVLCVVVGLCMAARLGDLDPALQVRPLASGPGRNRSEGNGEHASRRAEEPAADPVRHGRSRTASLAGAAGAAR